MSFEQLVEKIAHTRRIWAISENHGEVMQAKESEKEYYNIAKACGFNIGELRSRVRSRFLDLFYDEI